MQHRGGEYSRTILPGEPIDEIVEAIRAALAEGHAVTVSVHDTTLSTQEAADVLGISRPTLVRLLDRGEIPFEQPGSHRRLRREDVLEFQRRHRSDLAGGAADQ